MTDKTKKALDNILDCFGGADGGASFCRLKCLVEDMD